jgi:hypothetical protein
MQVMHVFDSMARCSLSLLFVSKEGILFNKKTQTKIQNYKIMFYSLVRNRCIQSHWEHARGCQYRPRRTCVPTPARSRRKRETGCPEKEESKPVRETQYPERNENDNSRQARPLVTRTNGGRAFKMAIR